MAIRFKKKYVYGIVLGLIILAIDFSLFLRTRWFFPLLGLALTAAWFQVWLDYFKLSRERKEYESSFLDFVRNFSSALRSGMPVAKAVSHAADNDYGALNRHVKKLAHQVEWSIPLHKALNNFSKATGNDVIKRAVSTVIEAEKAGGNIEDVLESITESLIEIKKIKETRRASVHNQVMQSYIIFFVFLGVMIIIQNLLIPYIANMQAPGAAGFDIGTADVQGMSTYVSIKWGSFSAFTASLKDWFVSLHGVFLMLALIQGFFAGLIIGKLSEGDVSSGFKHSLILMTIAFLIITLSQG